MWGNWPPSGKPPFVIVNDDGAVVEDAPEDAEESIKRVNAFHTCCIVGGSLQKFDKDVTWIIFNLLGVSSKYWAPYSNCQTADCAAWSPGISTHRSTQTTLETSEGTQRSCSYARSQLKNKANAKRDSNQRAQPKSQAICRPTQV